MKIKWTFNKIPNFSMISACLLFFSDITLPADNTNRNPNSIGVLPNKTQWISLNTDINSLSGPSAPLADCLKPNEKQKTIDQFISVKRTLGCRFSNNPNTCSISLGIGTAAAIGAAVATKVRAPNYHLCPIDKSVSIRPNNLFFQIAFAGTGPGGCVDYSSLVKQEAKNIIFQTLTELQNELNYQKQLKEILNNQLKALNKGDFDLYKKLEMEKISLELSAIEKKHPNFEKIESNLEKLKSLQNELFVAQKKNNLDDLKLLSDEKRKLQSEIKAWQQEIESLDSYQQKKTLLNKMTDKNYAIIDSTKKASALSDLKNDLNKSLENCNAAIAKIIEEQKSFSNLRALLSKQIVNKDNLTSVLDQLYEKGYTSPAIQKRLEGLKFFESANEHAGSFYKNGINKNHRSQLLKNKSINPISRTFGIAGLGLGFLSAATNAASNPELKNKGSAFASQFLSDSLNISSLGCADNSSNKEYYSSELMNQTCIPNYSLDNGKSQNFYNKTIEEAQEAINKDPNLCRMIKYNYFESFPNHFGVSCNKSSVKINLEDGNYIQIPEVNSSVPPNIFEWKQNGILYKFRIDSMGETEELRIINGKSITIYKSKDPTAKEVRDAFQRNLMADATETLACCNKDSIRPSDSDCAKKGIKTFTSENTDTVINSQPNTKQVK